MKILIFLLENDVYIIKVFRYFKIWSKFRKANDSFSSEDRHVMKHFLHVFSTYLFYEFKLFRQNIIFEIFKNKKIICQVSKKIRKDGNFAEWTILLGRCTLETNIFKSCLRVLEYSKQILRGAFPTCGKNTHD